MFLRKWKQSVQEMFDKTSKHVPVLSDYWQNGKSQPIVGLDISPDYIKLLKINSLESVNKVEKFAIIPLAPGVIVKNEIKDYPALVNAIKELFRMASVTTKFIALSIPRSSAIIKSVVIDKRLKPDEVESRAWIEANRHFPDLVGDIYLDFTVVGPSAQDSTQLELVLVACRKEQIKPYLEVLRQAGLVAKIVDINSYALHRALSSMTLNITDLHTIALLNLDLTLSTLIVSHENNLIYAHDQSFDGTRWTKQIQKYMSEQESKLPSDSQSLLDDVRYSDLMKENLSSHLRHTIHFFYSSRPNINIQRLILGGDCARIPGLALFIQKETGLETLEANPFVNMIIENKVDAEKLKQQASALVVSCGLALSKEI